MNYNNYEEVNDLNKITRIIEKAKVSLDAFMTAAYSIVMDGDFYGEVFRVKIIKGDSQKIVEISAVDLTFYEYLQMVQTNIDAVNTELTNNEYNAIIVEENESDINCVQQFIRGLSYSKNGNKLSYNFFDKTNKFNDYGLIISERFKKVYNSFINDQSINIHEIDIISDFEYGLIHKYSTGEKSLISAKPFHVQFQDLISKHSSEIAVLCGNDSITYGELNTKSNKLSNYIQNVIKCRNRLIGIFLDRSIDYLASILAIMKSGNAYVPIDPDTLSPGHNSFPMKRLEFMLDDAQMPLIITNNKYEEIFDNFEIPILNVENTALNQYSAENSNIEVNDNDLIYGIYTSGSTGTPKLTLVEHRSINNLYNSLNKYVFLNIERKIESNTVLSINAPFGFDASLQQIVGLMNGHILCIIPENIRNSVNNLLNYVNDKKINVFDCTPTQLSLLLENGMLNKCSSLEAILVGGEAIPDKMWDTLRNEHRIKIFNVYGPTECTVDSTIYCINDGLHDSPVIGRPIDNSNMYILDSKLKPVPLGRKGALYISGLGVSRGYYNREDLNAKAFLTIENLSHSDKNFYFTGDIGRCLFDGNIQCIGRMDSQVKIRSHRIELSEVRFVLNKHEDIKDSVVIVKDELGYQALIAYYIPVVTEVDDEKLRSFLSQYLPKYMIPNHFVSVRIWPTTKNNKIDIGKLPVIPLSHIKEEALAMNNLEKDIAEIVAKILNIKQMGLRDNFMTLGGDSLRVMTLLAKIYEKYKIEIDFTEFFDTPTIEFICEKIRNSGNNYNEEEANEH